MMASRACRAMPDRDASICLSGRAIRASTQAINLCSFGAIVAPDDETLGLARRIEELSEERVRAFADLPTAVQWLQDQLRAPDRSYC
jgi:hypothetical protein